MADAESEAAMMQVIRWLKQHDLIAIVTEHDHQGDEAYRIRVTHLGRLAHHVLGELMD